MVHHTQYILMFIQFTAYNSFALFSVLVWFQPSPPSLCKNLHKFAVFTQIFFAKMNKFITKHIAITAYLRLSASCIALPQFVANYSDSYLIYSWPRMYMFQSMCFTICECFSLATIVTNEDNWRYGHIWILSMYMVVSTVYSLTV